MNPRDLKFRMWSFLNKSMSPCACFQQIAYQNYATLLDPLNARYVAIMQYTGIKDELGVEIYEGDILELNLQNDFGSYSPGRAEVYYNTERTEFSLRHPKDLKAVWGLGSRVKVVGDIYRNPDLLK